MLQQGPPTAKGTVIVGFACFLLGALFTWGLPTGEETIGFQMKDLPSWLQAVGGLAAIVVAVWIPTTIKHAEQREAERLSKLRAKSAALAIIPPTTRILSSLTQAHSIANESDTPDLPDFEFAARLCSISEQMQDLLLLTHELGAPATPLQRALASVPVLQLRLNDADFYHSHHGVYFAEGEEYALVEPEAFGPLLDQTISDLKQAISQMQALFD